MPKICRYIETLVLSSCVLYISGNREVQLMMTTTPSSRPQSASCPAECRRSVRVSCLSRPLRAARISSSPGRKRYSVPQGRPRQGNTHRATGPTCHRRPPREALHRVHAAPSHRRYRASFGIALSLPAKFSRNEFIPPPMVATLFLPPFGLLIVALWSHFFVVRSKM